MQTLFVDSQAPVPQAGILLTTGPGRFQGLLDIAIRDLPEKKFSAFLDSLHPPSVSRTPLRTPLGMFSHAPECSVQALSR